MARQKRTLVQAVMDLFFDGSSTVASEPEVLEFSIFNPLIARRGDTIKIPSLSFLPEDVARIGMDLVEIDEYSRVIDGKSYPFTDYLCRYRMGSVDEYLTLRLIPRDDRPPQNSMIVLTKDWEDVYQEGLHKKELPSGQYRVRNPKDHRRVGAVYERVAGLRSPYKVIVREIKENEDSVSRYDLQLWDFVRTLSTEEGVGQEFYFVEMETESGMMRGYVGKEISADEVELIKTQAVKEQRADLGLA